jgi:hypothetical protein
MRDQGWVGACDLLVCDDLIAKAGLWKHVTWCSVALNNQLLPILSENFLFVSVTEHKQNTH